MFGFVRCLVVLVVFASSSSLAVGDLVVSFAEVGGNVESTATGSIDLAGLSSTGTFATGGRIFTGDANFAASTPRVSVGGFASYDAYFGTASGPAVLGPAPIDTVDTTGSTDVVLFRHNDVGTGTIGVPVGYVSGDAINVSSVYNGASLDSLGVTPGTYVWNFGNNTITLTASVAVPEPGAMAFLVLAATALTASRRRNFVK